MADLPNISRGDSMIEHIKEIAPFVAIIVASIAGWWAWRTSLLKALSDRVVHLESRMDTVTAAHGAAVAQLATVTAELILERGRREIAEQRERKIRERWAAKREQEHSNPGIEQDSEADVLDELEATGHSDTSGLIAVPPGGMPR